MGLPSGGMSPTRGTPPTGFSLPPWGCHTGQAPSATCGTLGFAGALASGCLGGPLWLTGAFIGQGVASFFSTTAEGFSAGQRNLRAAAVDARDAAERVDAAARALSTTAAEAEGVTTTTGEHLERLEELFTSLGQAKPLLGKMLANATKALMAVKEGLAREVALRQRLAASQGEIVGSIREMELARRRLQGEREAVEGSAVEVADSVEQMGQLQGLLAQGGAQLAGNVERYGGLQEHFGQFVEAFGGQITVLMEETARVRAALATGGEASGALAGTAVSLDQAVVALRKENEALQRGLEEYAAVRQLLETPGARAAIAVIRESPNLHEVLGNLAALTKSLVAGVIEIKGHLDEGHAEEASARAVALLQASAQQAQGLGEVDVLASRLAASRLGGDSGQGGSV